MLQNVLSFGDVFANVDGIFHQAAIPPGPAFDPAATNH